MAMTTSNYREAAEAAKTPEHWSKAARNWILIVEDDRLSLKVLRQLLGARGYDVLQASGGWDAISRARHELPDLILMDLRLPDISGLDATRLLKMDDQTKNIPIIPATSRPSRVNHPISRSFSTKRTPEQQTGSQEEMA